MYSLCENDLDAKDTNAKVYKPPRIWIYRGKKVKAKSVAHAEYEILGECLNNIPLNDVQEALVNDEVSEKRFKQGAKNVATLIRNLMARRQHRLPKEHEHYKQKEDENNDD